MSSKITIGSILFASLLATAACKKDDKDAEKDKGKDTSGKVTTDKGKTAEPDKTKEPAKTLTSEELAAWYQQCWGYFNDKKWDEFKGCFADEVMSEMVDSGQPPAKGPDETVAHSKAFAEAFPDIKGTPAIVLVNGNNIVGVWHIAGTHTAPLKGMGPQDIPPTSKKIGFLLAHSVEANAAGKGVKQASLFDGGTMMGQLGLMPEGMPFRAVSEAPASAEVVIAKNDDVEKKNLETYNAGVDSFNKHDLEAFKAMAADGIVFSEQLLPKDQNKEEMLKGLGELWKGMSDIKVEPASIWAAGEYVVASGSMSGTNDGDMPGMKATGKKVTLRYVEIAHFDKDTKVDKIWLFFNGAAMAQQMGFTDAPK